MLFFNTRVRAHLTQGCLHQAGNDKLIALCFFVAFHDPCGRLWQQWCPGALWSLQSGFTATVQLRSGTEEMNFARRFIQITGFFYYQCNHFGKQSKDTYDSVSKISGTLATLEVKYQIISFLNSEF